MAPKLVKAGKAVPVKEARERVLRKHAEALRRLKDL